MTLVELLADLHEQCGIASAPPMTAQNPPTAEMRRLLNWIKRAWLLIQTQNDNWLWMNGEFTFQTVANQREYLPGTHILAAGTANPVDLAGRFRRYQKDTLRCWKTSEGQSGEQFLVEWDHNSYRDTYQFAGQIERRDRPVVFAVKPETRGLLLGDVPDGIYTVQGRYHKGPQALTADLDVPEMPAAFHPLIVYRAMMFYGLFESAQEVLVYASTEYKRLLSDLQRDQLPETGLGRPLA